MAGIASLFDRRSQSHDCVAPGSDDARSSFGKTEYLMLRWVCRQRNVVYDGFRLYEVASEF